MSPSQTITQTSVAYESHRVSKDRLTGLSLATPSSMAKISVKPIATHKLSKTLARGDFTCFQKQTCMRIVSAIPSNDIEQPTVEIVSNILRSVSVIWKRDSRDIMGNIYNDTLGFLI